MAVPTQVTWECKPHTQAKHQILRRYLEAWYPILMSRFGSITYAEGFAGAGVYANGHPGSPIVAADVFLGRPSFMANKVLNMVLVEQDSRRITRLREEMATACLRVGAVPSSSFQVTYKQGECGSELLPALAKAGALRGPIFAFLDSFGGPDVPFSVVRSIAGQPSSEVLVTFGTNFLTRFGAKDQHQQSGDEFFGSQAWREVHNQPSNKKKKFLVDAYRNSLNAAGFTHVVSFEMIDDTGSDLHLVFGTGSREGWRR